MNITIPNNWHPRPYQVPLWNYLCAGGKRAVVCAHRRWGKDDVSLNHTACAMLERRANYGHMLPEYEQGRKAIWDAVNPKTGIRRIDEAFPVEMRNPSGGTDKQAMKIVTQPDGNGRVSTWQVLGSDNYNSLMGTSYAGIVKSEEALSDPSAWAYLSPILRENDGWAMFISTPRGHNHFERLLKTAMSTSGWYGEVSSVEKTNVFTPDELQMELVQLQDLHGETFGKSLWLQEYFCSFEAAIPGSFWAESLDALQLRGAICTFEHDRAKPVFTVGDLGRTDDTAIWFYQIEGDQLDIMDYWAGNGCEIYDPLNPDRSICHLFLMKAEQHGYRYARHWWPHDARPRRLGMGGKSILQQFVEAGQKETALGQFSIVPHLDVQEGIQAGRATFRHVRRFHAERCQLGLEALRHYHREWDAEKKMYLDHPVHDFASHCFTGETEVLTRNGTCSISSLPITGEVLTLCGWKRYENPRITRRNAPLVEVVFEGGLSVKCTPDHLFLTESGWISAQSLTSTMQIQSSLTPLRSISTAVSIGYGRVISICREAGRRFTEMSGRWPLGQSLKAAISTIKTATQEIISSIILNASPQACTSLRRAEETTRFGQSILLQKHEQRLPIGTVQKRGGSGTDGTTLDSNRGPNGNISPCSAQGAIKSFKAFLGKTGIHKSFAQKNAKCLSIVSVSAVSQPADVWCLTVPGVEHFSLSNGAIVHNCADGWRYLSLSWQPTKIMHPVADPRTILTDRPTMAHVVAQHFEKRKRQREWSGIRS